MNPLFLNPWFIVVSGALLLGATGAGFFEGTSIAGDRWQHRIDALHQQAELVADAEADQASQAAISYELGRAKARVIYKKTVQEVDHVIEGNTVLYSRECFDDDGLRAVNKALTRSQAASGRPSDGMPGPDAPDGRPRGDGVTQADGSQ